MRGWSNYFKHAVAKHTMSSLENFVWHRVIRTAEMEGRPPTPHWPQQPLGATLGGWGRAVQPRQGPDHAIPASRRPDPQPLDPGQPRLTADTVESPLRGNSHSAFGERPGGNGPTATSAPRPRPTQPSPSTCPQISDAAVSSRCLRRYGRNGVLPVPIVVGLAGLDCACLNTYSAAYPRCRDLNRSIQVMQVL